MPTGNHMYHLLETVRTTCCNLKISEFCNRVEMFRNFSRNQCRLLSCASSKDLVFITDNDYVTCEVWMNVCMQWHYFIWHCVSLPVGSPFKPCLLNDPTTRALEYCRWQTTLVTHNYSPVQFIRTAVLAGLNIRNMYDMTDSSIMRDYHISNCVTEVCKDYAIMQPQ